MATFALNLKRHLNVSTHLTDGNEVVFKIYAKNKKKQIL